MIQKCTIVIDTIVIELFIRGRKQISPLFLFHNLISLSQEILD